MGFERVTFQPRRRGTEDAARWCAAVSVAAGIFAALASQAGLFKASALVKLAATDPIAHLARMIDPGFVLVNQQQHYDGVYYWAIAVDPLARGSAHLLIDQAAYRYGHPLHGWLAGMLSLGEPRFVPAALFLLSLGGLGVAAWAVSRLSVQAGASAWNGLLVAISPGLLYATTVSTTETVGAALVLLAVLMWSKQRWVPAAILMVLCCLDKEQYVAVPVGLALWELVGSLRSGRRPLITARTLATVAPGPVVLTVWYLYLHTRFGQFPSNYEGGNIGWPVLGWLDAFARAFALSGGTFDQSQIGAIAVPVLIATAVLLLAATVLAFREPHPLNGPLVLMVAITSCQGWLTLVYPHELIRTPAVAVLTAAVRIGCRRRPVLAEPAAGAVPMAMSSRLG